MKNKNNRINMDNFKLAVDNAYDHIVITDKARKKRKNLWENLQTKEKTDKNTPPKCVYRLY